jgi:rhamnosyltransferase subunit B
MRLQASWGGCRQWVSMARIVVVSAAYWGDVMPFVPVADELARRGHDVTFAVPEGFHDVLAGHRFDLVHLGTQFSPRELDQHGHLFDRATTVSGIRALMDLWIRQLTIEPADEIIAVLEGLDADLFLSHNTSAFVVRLVSDVTGVPLVVGHLFPMMIPSASQVPPILPVPRRLGPVQHAVNRAGWWVGRRLTARLMFDREINELRRRRGLAPLHANVGFAWEDAVRILLLSSRHYWPRPEGWPDHLIHTGFTVWGDPDAELPEDIRDYLETGEPPVLVTLGTSAGANARDAFHLAAEAVTAEGLRPLLLVGSHQNLERLGGRRDAWTFAPLPAVLPRCRAVVHASGHGTTAAALTAGIPQVGLPQGFDQVVHARRVVELNVGREVPWKRRSMSRLRSALRAVLDDDVARSATAFADRLRAEDGPGVAATAVEEVLA